MTPLSATLRSLLDEIGAAFARGETPSETLLAQLEARWRAERPDDLAGLTALLASLRVRPDQAKLAEAMAELGHVALRAKAQLDAFAPPDPLESYKGVAEAIPQE